MKRSPLKFEMEAIFMMCGIGWKESLAYGNNLGFGSEERGKPKFF